MPVAPIITRLISVLIRSDAGELPAAEAVGWDLSIVEEDWDGPGTQLRLRAEWQGPEAVNAGLVVRRLLRGTTPQRVLVPAVFYGDNGLGSDATRYPRLGPLDYAAFTAPSWDFASERTALPAVFAWHDDTVVWLAVAPHGSGVGFSFVEGAAELRVHLPGIERPFRHRPSNESPWEPLALVAPGGALEMTLWCGDLPTGDPAPYAQVQRALQRAWGGAAGREIDHRLARNAASAAADGLSRLHYKPIAGGGMLAETVSFDGTQVRDEMHVAWLSGAPTAYALLRHGLRVGNETAAGIARSVLDTVAGGCAPCGAFWGICTPGGWKAGWNGHPQKLHARTVAEATLFLVRALALEPDHPHWAAAVRSNLDFCIRSMNESGNPGSYYHAQTGEVMDRRGTAGLLWAAALAEAADVLAAPDYLQAALLVGASYADAIRDGALFGAPEDVGLCPSSEDGYNALIAAISLHKARSDPKWLDLARVAADWLLTFRWSYDVRFPDGSSLAKRGFRTRGADAASPSNHHLHCYALICQSELLALSNLLGDDWYAARAADHLACFLSEVALYDGQFGGHELAGARRGMMSEQWFTAQWQGAPGEMLPVSHAWSLGLLLLAADDSVGSQQSAVGSELALPTPNRRPPTAYCQPPTADSPHPVCLLPGLYQVGGGYLSHPRDAASYLLVDEASGKGLMIDCGSHSGLDALCGNVAQVTDIERLEFVIGTHCHWDHVEGFGHLRERTGALFAIHEFDSQAVLTGDPNLTCAGFLYNEVFHPFSADIMLRGGERFEIGDFGLEILHLPGHSPGCIGVLVRYKRTDQTILIPGDSVQGAFGRRIHSNVAAWKKSMLKLMAQPIDFMVPNHLPDGAQTSLLADVPNRLARVYSQLQTDFHSFMSHQRT